MHSEELGVTDWGPSNCWVNLKAIDSKTNWSKSRSEKEKEGLFSVVQTYLNIYKEMEDFDPNSYEMFHLESVCDVFILCGLRFYIGEIILRITSTM